MKKPITNTHEQTFGAGASEVGRLLDSLGSKDDRMWPGEKWPQMTIDLPIQAGAGGRHGPISYLVEEYEPGRRIRFRFLSPRGFKGTHRFEVVPIDQGRCKLVHVLEMEVSGVARLSWPLVFRPLHDALLEDLLDKAQGHISSVHLSREWSPWVRILRRGFRQARILFRRRFS